MAIGTSPNLSILITGNSKQFEQTLKELELKAKLMNKEISKDEYDKMKLSMDRQKTLEGNFEKSYARIKSAALIATAAFASGLTASIVQFAQYETALVGVAKTTNITGQELTNLGNSIRTLAKRTGESSVELLGIAQSAGQLGVHGSANILKFTETIAKLGTASNLSGEIAATTLARLLSISGESVETVDRLASVIVRLGNNFAATESEIAFTAQEIASAGVQFGVSAAEASALAAAFTQLGVTPELARSSVTRVMIEMQKAISNGGKALEVFSAVSGMTGEQLKTTFKENATEAFTAFLTGVGQLGDKTIPVLEELNLNDIRLAATLPKLGSGISVVNDALSQMQDELTNTVALNNEFNAANQTTQKGVDKLKETLRDAGISIGEIFAPAVESASGAIASGIESMGENFKRNSENIVKWLDSVISKWQEFKAAIFGESEEVLNAEAAFSAVKANAEEQRRIRAEALAKQKEDRSIANQEEIQEISVQAEEKRAKEQEEFEKDQAAEAERQSVIDEVVKAQKEKALEAEEEDRESKLEREQRRFEEDLERLTDRLEEIDDTKSKFEGMDVVRDLERLKRKAKTTKQEEDIEKAIAKAKKEILDKGIADELSSFSGYLDQKTALGKAAFAFEKGLAIATAIQNIHVGVSEALKLPPPESYVLAALTAAKGAAEVASLTSNTIQVLGAENGGIVPGGFGGGDKVPFMLEPGEIIVPSALNPLNPNFNDVFGGTSGTQAVNVTIGLEEDASRVLTVKQREDSTLGIQK